MILYQDGSQGRGAWLQFIVFLSPSPRRFTILQLVTHSTHPAGVARFFRRGYRRIRGISLLNPAPLKKRHGVRDIDQILIVVAVAARTGK